MLLPACFLLSRFSSFLLRASLIQERGPVASLAPRLCPRLPRGSRPWAACPLLGSLEAPLPSSAAASAAAPENRGGRGAPGDEVSRPATLLPSARPTLPLGSALRPPCSPRDQVLPPASPTPGMFPLHWPHLPARVGSLEPCTPGRCFACKS